MRRSLARCSVLGLLATCVGLVWCRPAHACGGLFSDPNGLVNLAAWRILFADDGAGTITMAVEVRYDGAPEEFGWLLPVQGIPELRVASTVGFDRLQRSTNPRYTLDTREEGSCSSKGGAPDAGGGAGGVDGGTGGGVTIAAEGTVGPYLYTVLSLDPQLDDAAQVASDWLAENGYGAPDGTAALVRPYLEDGLNLLAFRLTKGNDVGAIRPVVVSYQGDAPSIPLTLASVATNDDVGILVWVLSDSRAFPSTYKALELNEALIDWFDPARTYDDVVSAAADEAEGQGFVTELAGKARDVVDGVVWGSADEDELRALLDLEDDLSLVERAGFLFGTWDGFIELMRMRVTPPTGLSVEDFLACPRCSPDRTGFTFEREGFEEAFVKDVVQPMRDMQALLDSRPYLTRLYTTMSADEMTVDPVFELDAGGLGDVSNVHEAERVIECSRGVSRDEAPYRIELPQGDVVRGLGDDDWPIGMDDGQPATRRILALTASGGDVVQDNREQIADLLAAHNATIPGPPESEDCGCRTLGAARHGSSNLPFTLALLLACGLELRGRARSTRAAGER